MNLTEIVSIITLIILFATACAGVIYAWFTYGLLKNSITQAKQKLLPLPVVYRRKISESGRVRRIFRIRNIGYGAALNIEIENFYLRIKDNIRGKKIDKTYRYVLKMDDPNILVKDEERDLISETYLKDEQLQNWDLSAYLDPEFSRHNIPMKISYQDVTGRKYSLEISFGTGRLGITKFPNEEK